MNSLHTGVVEKMGGPSIQTFYHLHRSQAKHSVALKLYF